MKTFSFFNNYSMNAKIFQLQKESVKHMNNIYNNFFPDRR